MKPWQADALLLALTFIWGATFVLVKAAMATLSPLPFLFARFTLGAAALAPFAWARRGRLGAADVQAGLAAGLLMFAGFALQTWGLVSTTPARAGFLTGLSVILVPVLQAFLGSRPPARIWAGAALATAGLFLLTQPGGGGVRLGDVLVLLCALAFALQILVIDRFARRTDPVLVAFVETAVVAAASGAGSLVDGAAAGRWTPVAWAALVVCGLLATAAGNLLQTVAQRHTTPAHTALIFTCEPVFSLVFAWAFWGEKWTGATLLGGACVLAGMLAGEWPGARQPGASPGRAPAAGAEASAAGAAAATEAGSSYAAPGSEAGS
ncbi:MAG: DMT family transporter [Firmicutes bacterium]|nr:DMT family transporter [Bacillota bacterium]